MMKQCFKCGAYKELDDFYKHRQMADGHLNKCKQCTKNDASQNRAENHEYYLVYDRIRYDVQGFRGNKRSIEEQRHYKRDWSKKNKQKRNAHNKVKRAIEKGILTKQPCGICGSIDGVEAHHEDYNKPLDVKWLCSYHHGLTRRKSRRLSIVDE